MGDLYNNDDYNDSYDYNDGYLINCFGDLYTKSTHWRSGQDRHDEDQKEDELSVAQRCSEHVAVCHMMSHVCLLVKPSYFFEVVRYIGIYLTS